MKKEIEDHIPDRIYLQYFGEDDPEMLDKPPETEMGRSEVSWCRERVYKHDIEYVRVEKKRSEAFKQMLATMPDGEEFLATLSEGLKHGDDRDEQIQKLRSAIRKTIVAIEAGQKGTDNCGGETYTQMFGRAFVDMLYSVQADLD